MAGKKLTSVKVLLAKAGLDGHDRGIKVIARCLRDAGMHVIYTGIKQTPEAIVETALQEGVDAIGLSILSGAHMTVFPSLLRLLKKKKMGHVILIGGGIIPAEDIKKLEEMGVHKLWGPDTPTQEIIDYLNRQILNPGST